MENKEEIQEDEDSIDVESVLPKRLSEIHVTQKIKPIPNTSSLFIFSPTNR
jgi:hypothetical protein